MKIIATSRLATLSDNRGFYSQPHGTACCTDICSLRPFIFILGGWGAGSVTQTGAGEIYFQCEILWGPEKVAVNRSLITQIRKCHEDRAKNTAGGKKLIE